MLFCPKCKDEKGNWGRHKEKDQVNRYVPKRRCGAKKETNGGVEIDGDLKRALKILGGNVRETKEENETNLDL